MQLIKQGMEDGVIDYVEGNHVVTPFGMLELKALVREAFPGHEDNTDELDNLTKRALLLSLKYVDPKGKSFHDETKHSPTSH